MAMIKNCIFDFGQVLVEFVPEKLTAVYTDNADDIRLISDAVFDRLYWDRLDDGTITDSEVRSAFCARLPVRLHETALKAYDNWIENLVPISEVVSLLPQIKKSGGRLYLLSNISRGFAEKYRDIAKINDILSLFDGMVFSGTLGITKPNKEIFEHLLYTFGLNAEESIFIDDNINNIIGAEKAGIKGYLFDGDTEKLKLSLF